jgi:hypothetical protein
MGKLIGLASAPLLKGSTAELYDLSGAGATGSGALENGAMDSGADKAIPADRR